MVKFCSISQISSNRICSAFESFNCTTGYLYIPFNFQIAGKQCDKIPCDTSNQIPEASFSLVLRQKGGNIYDVALNTKLYAVQFPDDSLVNGGTIENYYTVDGNWINSWLYNSNIASPQKIYKKQIKIKMMDQVEI